MKTSSTGVNQAKARNCFLMNQFATPGLGSLMVGRFVAGTGQLCVFLVGFVGVVIWCVLTLKEAYTLAYDTGPARSYNWLGAAGALIALAAWFWSLLTSLSVLREAKTQENDAPQEPPVINPDAKI